MVFTKVAPRTASQEHARLASGGGARAAVGHERERRPRLERAAFKWRAPEAEPRAPSKSKQQAADSSAALHGFKVEVARELLGVVEDLEEGAHAPACCAECSGCGLVCFLNCAWAAGVVEPLLPL